MKAKVVDYVICFDTNILRSNPLSNEVKGLLKTYKKDSRLKIRFFVPEIVLEEYKKFFLDAVTSAITQHNGGAKTIKDFMKTKVREVKLESEKILKKGEKTILHEGIKIARTPYEKIDLKSLVKKAVYYESPFSKNEKEKGFKDSIIAETILNILSEYTLKTNIVFVCADKNLREYASTFSANHPNFIVFESIPDFESHLRLYLEKIDKKIRDEITKEAELVFFRIENKDSLFYKTNIIGMINEKFPGFQHDTKLRTIDTYTDSPIYPLYSPLWTAIDNGSYGISKPVFNEKKGNTYIWTTTVVYRQRFERSTTQLSEQAVVEPEKVQSIHEFKVKWQSNVGKDGKILDAGVIDISKGGFEKRREGHFLDISIDSDFAFMRPYLGRASGATLAGQGTVPVTTTVIPASTSRIPGVPTTTIVEPIGMGFQNKDDTKN